jgi:hypothetical protein
VVERKRERRREARRGEAGEGGRERDKEGTLKI